MYENASSVDGAREEDDHFALVMNSDTHLFARRRARRTQQVFKHVGHSLCGRRCSPLRGCPPYQGSCDASAQEARCAPQARPATMVNTHRQREGRSLDLYSGLRARESLFFFSHGSVTRSCPSQQRAPCGARHQAHVHERLASPPCEARGPKLADWRGPLAGA
jgi:hypothetical protein